MYISKCAAEKVDKLSRLRSGVARYNKDLLKHIQGASWGSFPVLTLDSRPALSYPLFSSNANMRLAAIGGVRSGRDRFERKESERARRRRDQFFSHSNVKIVNDIDRQRARGEPAAISIDGGGGGKNNAASGCCSFFVCTTERRTRA